MEIDLKKIIKDLIKEYPNDYELGGKVRDLIKGLEKINKDVVQEKSSTKK